jgi:hypothetical protein
LRKSIKKIEQRNNSVDFCISNENSFIEKHWIISILNIFDYSLFIFIERRCVDERLKTFDYFCVYWNWFLCK